VHAGWGHKCTHAQTGGPRWPSGRAVLPLQRVDR
jgi:hypothetical protein